MDKIKNLNPFDKMGLLEVNKALKDYFKIFYEDAEKIYERFTGTLSNTLTTVYVIDKIIKFDFLNKTEESILPIRIQWEISIKNDTILVKLYLKQSSRRHLDWNEYNQVYNTFKNSRNAQNLIDNIKNLFKSRLNFLGYEYKISINDERNTI